jgi:hypothetical protein
MRAMMAYAVLGWRAQCYRMQRMHFEAGMFTVDVHGICGSGWRVLC